MILVGVTAIEVRLTRLIYGYGDYRVTGHDYTTTEPAYRDDFYEGFWGFHDQCCPPRDGFVSSDAISPRFACD